MIAAAHPAEPLIRLEAPDDAPAVEAVLARAFGPGRLAKVSERVRERCAVMAPDWSMVAVGPGGAVLGCCRMWRTQIGPAPAAFLGPLAVDPDAQGLGLGGRLVGSALAALGPAPPPVLLVGAAAFFAPFGFVVFPRGQVTMPGPVDPARLLWRLPAGAAAPQGELTAPPAARPA